ncbi:unnamed protein product, partial [Hapterophycus canaliculatus]
ASGVYFGWAGLEEADDKDGEGGGAGNESGVEPGPWKCVANVGYSPTFAGQENAEKIVEGHLIGYEGMLVMVLVGAGVVVVVGVGDDVGGDFYGKTMRMLLAGFQRREKKFASFPELVATINKVGKGVEMA